MSFIQLDLSNPLLKAISEQGYTKPTPIQKQAIPLILQGRDMLAGAQTGTGKTAGFALPLLQLLHNQPLPKKPHPIRALILTPTRELAMQVYESFTAYGRHLPLFSEVVFGGVSIHAQIRRLQQGTDILVATPGRLLDLLYQKQIDLGQVQFFVLDEADRMLDMGFIKDICKVLKVLPEQRQNLLFSATYDKEVKTLAAQLLQNPVEVAVARENITADKVAQRVYAIKREYKRELISWLIGHGNWQQVLVFVMAMVFVSESHHPWWVARVDSQPARVLRAQNVFMAVGVAPGRHQIELALEPPLPVTVADAATRGGWLALMLGVPLYGAVAWSRRGVA